MTEMNTILSKVGNIRGLLLSLIPSLIVDALLPFLLYILLRPHTTEVLALIVSSVPPLLSNIVSFIRNKQFDAFGIMIFFGIVVSLIALLFGGDPRVLLIRESFVTVAIGVACLVSLLFPKPLMFYISKHFATGADESKNAWFNSLWQYKRFRFLCYLITVVWAVADIGEFAIKVILAFTLPIAQAILIGPLVTNTLTVGLIIWSILYSVTTARKLFKIQV
jgi:hypothetical protein